MTQTTLWLLPLVLGSLFGLGTALKMGIAWSWGLIMQHTIVLLIALTGLYLLPSFDWLCAYLGWALMLSYTLVARMFLLKMTRSLGLLRCEQAVTNARILKYLLWGPPGRFWFDLACMINFYLRKDIKAGEAIFKKWHDFGLPRTIDDSLTAYAMLGLLIMRNWKSAADKYEETRKRYETELAAGKKDARFPFQTAVPAIRALTELGRYGEAREALVLADLPSVSYGRESLENVFLSFFAMIGDGDDLNNLLARMKGVKTGLPEHARLYWEARCAGEQRDYEKSVLKYAESLRKTPEKDTAWRERTQNQMRLTQELMQEGSPAEVDPALAAEKAESARVGRQIMNQCFAVADILNSRKPPHAVRVLTGIISVMFFCSCYPYFMQEKSSFIFDWGYLSGALVMAGQWWRLASYMFLHGGASHLLMNVFGLVWFGRFVENIFGTTRFLIIFFATGILSGAVQMLMSAPDDKAVGASGAILGVFGAGLAATLRLKNVLPRQVRRHELSWMIALAVTQLVFDQVVNFLFPAGSNVRDAVRIAAAAHFSGMVSGFAIGWLLPLRKPGTAE